MKVTDAHNNNFTPVNSAARIVFTDRLVALIVPASEFSVPNPRYRVTAFNHAGDYCANLPRDCGGDIEPAVADGLKEYSF